MAGTSRELRAARRETAGPSTTLPRISCRYPWRWGSACGSLYGEPHTWPSLAARGRKFGFRSGRDDKGRDCYRVGDSDGRGLARLRRSNCRSLLCASLRDDNLLREPNILRLSSCGHNRIVIPTGADPDFLLRTASKDHMCGSPRREPHAVDQRRCSRQEIRGSAVEGPAVSFPTTLTPSRR
jgi:hypothetical protein